MFATRLLSTSCSVTLLSVPRQVYLRQLVCVSAAWRVPQLTGFLDERASMMGVQTQIGEVLDQMDRMSSLCVDLQHQVGWGEGGASCWSAATPYFGLV